MRAPSLHLDLESRPSERGLAVALALVALMGATASLQVIRDRRFGVSDQRADVLYVRSPRLMEKLALSYDALFADIYWIRAIQQYGAVRDSSQPKLTAGGLYPLLDITTTLDPGFTMAYRFGAIFLAEPPPNGPGRPADAIKLLTKAIQTHPREWRYVIDLGFVYYWWLHDYETAAAWFDRAADVPGAPQALRALAAGALIKGGSREASRFLWRQLLEGPDQESLRTIAELRLAQLDALDAIDRLDRLVARYAAQTGRTPGSWGALVAAGLLRSTPVDPAGTPFAFEARTGRVSVSSDSPLYPLPAEPRATGADR